MIVYISGPMRSVHNHNEEMFSKAEKALTELGVLPVGRFDGPDLADAYPSGWKAVEEVINPARNFGGDKTLPTTTYMEADLQQILRADAMVLLPGWQESEGAKLEVRVGRSIGLDFYEVRYEPNGADGDGAWWFEPVEEPGDGNGDADSPRAQSLRRALGYITGDRNCSYGPPTQDFDRTARVWNALGYRAPEGGLFQGHDVALLMMCLKISRLTWQPGKADSWDDVSGYSGCGYECAVNECAG